jgi:hypothetical protein
MPRALDFDNSPDKTFTFNPGTLNMADAGVDRADRHPERSGTFNSARRRSRS